MSSIPSEASPQPQANSGSSSSRHGSQADSPYEYDITSNVPTHSRRISESGSVGSIGSMTAALERTQLGSNQSLTLQSLNPQRSPQVNYDREKSSNFLTSSGENGSDWKPRTPLPHEIPNLNTRRASDPIRSDGNPSFSKSKSVQRVRSWNSMRAMQARNLRRQDSSPGPAPSSNVSTHSDLLTDQSLGDETDLESHLVESIADLSATIDDAEGENPDNLLLIPDDVREFLQEKYNETINKQRAAADSTVPDASPRSYTSQQDVRSPSQAGYWSGSGSSTPAMPHRPIATKASQGSRDCSSDRTACMHTANQVKQAQPQAACNTVSHNSTGQTQPRIQQPQQTAGKTRGVMPQPHLSQAPNSGINNNMYVQQQQHGIQQGHHQSMTGPGNQWPGMQQSQQMAGYPQQMVNNSSYPPGQSWGSNLQVHPMQGNYNNMGTMSPHHQQQTAMGPCYNPQQQQQPYGPQNNMNMMGNNMNVPMMQQQQPSQPGMYGQLPMNSMAQPECNNQWQAMMQSGMNQSNFMIQQQQNYGYNPNQMHAANNMGINQLPQMMNHSQRKPERSSPMVQVPHISQSQGMRQTHQNMPSQNMYGASYPNQNNVMANMAPNQQQNMMVPPTPHLADHSRRTQPMNYNNHQVTHSNGTMNNSANQMSPSCNQVSSTTDINKSVQTDSNNRRNLAPPPNQQPPHQEVNDLLECNLNSITTDNLIENLSSISMETINGNMLSPTALVARSASASQNSFVDGKMTSQSNQSFQMDTNNMVVNDMGSSLCQLMEENKYLSMR